MPYLTLSILENPFTIHRLPADRSIPAEVIESQFFILSRTDEDIAIAIPEGIEIQTDEFDPDWVCIKVNTPMDPGQIGVLSQITSMLGKQNISNFLTSTHDANYILVRIDQLVKAKRAMENTRCRFQRAQRPAVAIQK